MTNSARKGVKTKTLSYHHNSYMFYITIKNDTGILNTVIEVFLGNDKKVKVVLKSIIIEFSETFASVRGGGRGLGSPQLWSKHNYVSTIIMLPP